MTHNRTMPRDLFNEAKLLKGLGQLALLIHEAGGASPLLPASLHLDHDGETFAIEQHPHNGSLYVPSITLYVGHEMKVVALASEYNSKDPYPLTFDDLDRVFCDDGQFSAEFEDYCRTIDNKTWHEATGL